MKLVVDSSVVTKWFFDEIDASKARGLLMDWLGDRLVLMAPGLLAAEVAQALWKRALRGDLALDLALTLYGDFQTMCPDLTRTPALAREALEYALQYRHPVYDCLYVALAVKERCEFVTADEELFKSFRPSFPQVRLLRDWG